MRGKDGEVVIQYDKNFAELIGLVKFDFLGLKTLTVIESAVSLVKTTDPDFDIEHIDLEDKEVYDFISRGETIGVFQLESSGMIELCKRVAPSSLEDLTSVNALYRPGPLESGMVEDFVDRKHGRKRVAYIFPELEETLRDTYGVIVYQEQVMNIARIIAGYTLAQADILRRAMGKKKHAEMEHHRNIFVEGAQKLGHDSKKANELYELMVGFAAYGFNKSHAVAYAFIAYRTAYLKHYFTPQFFAALLSSEINDKDKVNTYIGEARRYGVEILPPDINTSELLFSVEGTSIRFGLHAIKNVGENSVMEIIKDRKKRGYFKGIFDFCARMPKINRKCLEGLILVGAFDKCDNRLSRLALFNSLPQIMRYAQERQKEQDAGMVSLFELVGHGEMIAGEDVVRKNLEIVDDAEFKSEEMLEYENEFLGIYVSGHPLDPFRPILNKLTGIGTLKSGGGKVLVAGMISDLKVFITKKGEKMCRFKLEDFTGKCDILVFPKDFATFENIINNERLFMITGNISSEEGVKIFAEKVAVLNQELFKQFKAVRFYLQIEQIKERDLDDLKRVILEHRGAIPVEIIFTSKAGKAKMILGDSFMVAPSATFLSKTASIFGERSLDLVREG